MTLGLLNLIQVPYPNSRKIILTFLVIFYIVFTAILAPFMESKGMTEVFKFINFLDSIICHQFPPRCHNLFGYNLGLCVRCFSFYLTILICILFGFFIEFIAKKKIKRYLFFILISPLVIDGLSQYLYFRESTNFIRTVTGVMAGIAVSILLLTSNNDNLITFYHKFSKGEKCILKR